MILRRFENDVIFEELGHWSGMEAMANYVIGNMMAVILEKNSNFSYFKNIGDYWIYHKLIVEDDEEEKV